MSVEPIEKILTWRQQEVLALVVEGLTNYQIARRLNIGEPTAKTHVDRLFTRTGTGSKAALVAWFYERCECPCECGVRTKRREVSA